VKQTILITGGCRSGKSRQALALADLIEGDNKFFIATCIPNDQEMRRRIARHKAERPAHWQTIEEPLAIAEAITQHQSSGDVILVDCLTLWMSNLLMQSESMEQIENHIHQLTKALQGAACPVILVTNEVGSGIVPENPLARTFRDTAGLANQRVAACADTVIYMVAGIPMTVKSGKIR
jgi:adenosylcobinamide kinase/adenosylcobinamide-phosphate guanylyltransferase